MPKVIAEIKKFTSGIVATPDSKDIPTDASDYSLNVEPMSGDGHIKGRFSDQYWGGGDVVGFQDVTRKGMGEVIAFQARDTAEWTA